MDFSKFSDDNFDLKDWINGAFKTQKDTNQQNTEQFVATLITKLQVFIQEINNIVDDTSQQTIQNFPRILREIEVLKQESFMLKEQMKAAREDIIKVEKNTVESMKMLLDLDTMKTNMTVASNSLQEADNWTTLTSDLEALIEVKDVEKITTRIQGLQQSLKILQDDSPDYINRCFLLENLKNRFESMLSSEIVDSFNSKTIDSAKNYVQIFEKIERLNELKKYYFQCRKIKILEKLGNIIETNNDLKQFLKVWLDYLIELWHNEIQWCKQVFNDPYSIVMHLLDECFIEFNKKLILALDVIVEKEATCLDILVHLKEDTDRFFQTIQSNLEANVKSHQVNDFLRKLIRHVYEPYKKYIKIYTKLESSRLIYELDVIKLDHGDTLECVQLLNLSIGKVINNAQLSIERCLKLTNSCGFYMLIEAFKNYFRNYLNEFRRVVSNLKERNLKVVSEEHENWDLFRHFLKLIQIFGEFIIQYEQLEDDIVNKINLNFIKPMSSNSASILSKLSQNEALSDEKSEFQLLPENYKEILLDELDRVKLNTLISNIESGDDYDLIIEINKLIFSLSEQLHKNAFDIVFSPIKFVLNGLFKSNMWNDNVNTNSNNNTVSQQSLPMFSLTPQEYITKIGQYLLTLPQNFEPFTMQDSTQLIVALKNGKLPYLEEKDLSSHITACWLDSIANATVSVFCEEILKIPHLSTNSSKQLVIDIEYICNVFDDVGLTDYLNLQYILELLKASKETFADVSKNKPARIVSAIRNMKNF